MVCLEHNIHPLQPLFSPSLAVISSTPRVFNHTHRWVSLLPNLGAFSLLPSPVLLWGLAYLFVRGNSTLQRIIDWTPFFIHVALDIEANYRSEVFNCLSYEIFDSFYLLAFVYWYLQCVPLLCSASSDATSQRSISKTGRNVQRNPFAATTTTSFW